MNYVSYFVKKLIDITTPQPQAQIELSNSGIHNDVEYFHQYGFKSIPPSDVETGLCVHVDGNEDNTVIISFVDDNAPSDIEEGETIIYARFGQKIYLKKNGSVIIEDNSGGSVIMESGNITVNCTNFSVNSTSFTHNGVNVGGTHVHQQNNGNDNGGDVNTGVPS